MALTHRAAGRCASGEGHEARLHGTRRRSNGDGGLGQTTLQRRERAPGTSSMGALCLTSREGGCQHTRRRGCQEAGVERQHPRPLRRAFLDPVYRSEPPESPGCLGSPKISSAASRLCRLHGFSPRSIPKMPASAREEAVPGTDFADTLRKSALRNETELILRLPMQPGDSGGQIFTHAGIESATGASLLYT